MDALDRHWHAFLGCILCHFQRGANLLVHPQYFVGHFCVMVHLWSHQHFLVTHELESTMEYPMEEVLGHRKLRHHAHDNFPHDWRLIHLSQGSYRDLQ